MMNCFGIMTCLLMLLMLMTTWVSSADHRDDTIAVDFKKGQENMLMKYLRNEMIDEMMIKGHRDNMGHLIHRYLKNEADRLLRSDGRLGRKSRRSLRGNENKDAVPFSTKRFEKMLEKAILKIITGDLSTADMMLLKSLNYSLEEVLAIRERELGKKIKESEVLTDVKGPNSPNKSDEEMIESGQSLTETTITKHKESKDNPDSKKITKDSSTVSSKRSKKNQEKIDDDFDFHAYNKQAVYDYENAANEMSQQELDPVSLVVDYDDRTKNIKAEQQIDDEHSNFNRAMEKHVVFKIRYDDSEFDSTSDERARQLSKEIKANHENFINPRETKDKNVSVMSSKAASWSSSKLDSTGINTTPGNHGDKTFQSSSHLDVRSSLPVVYRLGNFVTPHQKIDKITTERDATVETVGNDAILRNNDESEETAKTNADVSTMNLESDNVQVDLLVKNESSDESKRSNVYEGLEWVEDDVYRVIPQAVDNLNYDSIDNDLDNDTIEDSYGNENRTSDLESRMLYDDRNDTIYQNDSPEDENQGQMIRNNSSTRMPTNVSLSTYQQLAMAHRKDQGQKAIEDIKMKVLAMTGRYNLSSSSNLVQRERLTMFSPTCQAPRNTDLETWSDAFLMNMYFQLNLTSGDHVVAAKMRIYKLPQANVTIPSGAAAVEEEEEEEKKIRISIYFYTKSLKKHRSKKRLMDSIVTSLTSQGGHLALDVRQAIRFWRQNLRSSSHGNNSNNNNNHGLVIQVEDQDGRPLKPSLYIQQGSCHTSEQNEDDKAYQRVPALFIQACSRYVRVVNGEAVTYVNCSKSLRNDRH